MPVDDPCCPISLYARKLRTYMWAVEDMICEQKLEQARKVEAVRAWLVSLNIDPDRPLPFKRK
ncbi:MULTISPECIES: hypothetical protein [Asticcacaulis]|jgi:hypothetical protein|uniref:Uncharacterized protein n=1 Tax=Asticcacaulis endophyticus TaxID=1395890 RepID=A0A918PYX8_9CAUL|nr:MULTISPECIES: hypothetical protein [Asticcacaulis]WKL58883.1 hypothetical protein Q1W73_07820 [Asticcacaulis sp. ZE23SCel15]GGZ28042.1 hypothetical protein GCM10011273_12250 [Asticcacaulis endophyticus]